MKVIQKMQLCYQLESTVSTNDIFLTVLFTCTAIFCHIVPLFRIFDIIYSKPNIDVRFKTLLLKKKQLFTIYQACDHKGG